jgi:Fe/S biogenesis protein NfuA
LSQGIAVAITDAVAEISEVVDVTDHMLGMNPYFEPGMT